MITILNSMALQTVDINVLSTDSTLMISTAMQTVDIANLSSDNTMLQATAMMVAPAPDESGQMIPLEKNRCIIIQI